MDTLINDLFSDSLLQYKDLIFNTLSSSIIQLLPTLSLFWGLPLVINLLKFLITPKHEDVVFDNNYADDFGLFYDTMLDNYDSEEDLINDYFSDFHYFDDMDELDVDEIADESDPWQSFSDQFEYDNDQSDWDLYSDIYEFNDVDLSFTDYVEKFDY